jgi:ribosome maturation factor RimP
MNRQELILELTNIIAEYLKIKGFDLVDITYRYEGRDLILRVLVDRPCGGITIDECTLINKDIGTVLDEKDIIKDSYTLEVSSPGIGRPLRTKNDFSRCINRKVQIFLRSPIEGKLQWQGRIERIENEIIYIAVKDKVIEIPFSCVSMAKQLIDNV